MTVKVEMMERELSALKEKMEKEFKTLRRELKPWCERVRFVLKKSTIQVLKQMDGDHWFTMRITALITILVKKQS